LTGKTGRTNIRTEGKRQGLERASPPRSGAPSCWRRADPEKGAPNDFPSIVVGEDFALGKHRRGDVKALCAMGWDVVTCPLQAGADGRTISSSAMRAAIELARAPARVTPGEVAAT
jgi:hypothetical protein